MSQNALTLLRKHLKPRALTTHLGDMDEAFAATENAVEQLIAGEEA